MRLLISITVLLFITILTISAPVLAPNPAEAEFESFLARRFPQVDPTERRNIRQIPSNLYGLIRGADRKGRLTLPAPEPGHALLLTQPTDYNPKNPKVHGVGILTTPSGEVHYFRTIGFQPHEITRESAAKAPVFHPTNYIPARSHNEQLFPERKIKIDFGDGSYFKPKGKFTLSHLSVFPMDQVLGEEASVYHPDLVKYVQRGPQERSSAIIGWSRVPNWSKEDQKRASLHKLSPKKLYGSLRRKGVRGSKDGDSPWSSSGGSSGHGASGLDAGLSS